MKRTAFICSLLLVAAAGFGSCAKQSASADARVHRETSRTVTVRSRALQRTLRLSGTTEPVRSAVLLAPLLSSNRSHGNSSSFQLILSKLAPAGSWVRAGDVVAKFDAQYLATHLDDRAAGFEQQKANFQSLLVQLRVKREAHEQSIRSAKGEMDKAGLERKKGPVLSAIQSERDRLTHEESQARYRDLVKSIAMLDVSIAADKRRAELDLDETRLEVDRARTGLERLTLRAPIDGMVVALPIRRGAEQGLVQEGDELRTGQPFLQIVDGRSMMVHARANQVDASALKVGARARARFDIYPDLSLPARVTYVGALATAGGRTGMLRELPVRAVLEEMDTRVLPYLSAALDIVLDETPPASVLPRECVAYKEGSKKPFVLVRGPDGVRERPVEVIGENNIAVSVASGVQEGEKVICGQASTSER